METGDKTAAAEATVASAAPPTEVAPTAELVPEPDAVEELAAGRCGAVLIVPRDTRQTAASEAERQQGGGGGSAGVETVVLPEGALVKAALPKGRTVVLPGSYNPLHRGHLGLLEAARAALETSLREQTSPGSKSMSRAAGAATTAAAGTTASDVGGVGGGGVGDRMMVHGVFEISVANVDKGGLAAEEVRRRTAQFAEPQGVGWPYPVVVTRAPLFSQKVGGCRKPRVYFRIFQEKRMSRSRKACHYCELANTRACVSSLARVHPLFFDRRKNIVPKGFNEVVSDRHYCRYCYPLLLSYFPARHRDRRGCFPVAPLWSERTRPSASSTRDTTEIVR